MPLKFLGDFAKRSTDLWKAKKFAFNKTLEVSVDKGKSISWNGKHTLKDQGKAESELTFNQTEKDLGELELTWDSSNNPNLTLSSSELLDNTEVELEVEALKTGSASAEYSTADYAGKLKASWKEQEVTLNGDASFAWDKVTLGAAMEYDVSSKKFTKNDVGVRLDQDSDRTYALTSSKNFSQLAVSFYNKVSKETEVGAQVSIDMEDAKVGLKAGGSYVMDDKSKVRYSLDDQAALQMAYEYQLNDSVKASAGAKYCLAKNNFVGDIGYKVEFCL
jgi:hypothetical protein